MNLPSFNLTGVIPTQAGIHKKVVLFHKVSMDPRFRGDDNRGKDNKVSSCHRSISFAYFGGINLAYGGCISKLYNRIT